MFYVLALRVLHHLAVFASVNPEPVYGIGIAWIILKDNREVTPGFYLGVLIILAAVFSYPLLRRYRRRRAGRPVRRDEEACPTKKD